MSKRRPAWDNDKEKVAKKRMRKGEEKAATGPKGADCSAFVGKRGGQMPKVLAHWAFDVSSL